VSETNTQTHASKAEQEAGEASQSAKLSGSAQASGVAAAEKAANHQELASGHSGDAS